MLTSCARRCVLLVLPLLWACGSCGKSNERPAGTGRIELTLTGFANDDGQALISLFLTPDGFPSDADKAHDTAAVAIEGGRARHVFANVPAGPFAISAFHDLDSNFELATGTLGIPTEPWGVTRAASGFMGPPSFESARLELAADATLQVQIDLE